MVEKNPRARVDNYFETVLNKIKYVASENDYTLVAGDLLHIPCNSTLVFFKLYQLMKQYNVHGIFGNHDYIGRNKNVLDKTTIGALMETGAYNVHTTEFNLGDLTFVPMDVMDDPKTFQIDEDNSKILIAHKFYDQKFSPDESLFREDIERLNYDLVILGHDHKPYEELFVGNSTIIRMGSLTRMDVQCYNKDRGIFYYQIISDGEGNYEYECKEVPHEPIEKVYTEEAVASFGRAKQEREVSFVQIGEAIAKLSRSVRGVFSLEDVLRTRLNTPQNCIDEIKFKHEVNHVQFT